MTKEEKHSNFFNASEEGLAKWKARVESERPTRKMEGDMLNSIFRKIDLPRSYVANFAGLSENIVAKFMRGEHISRRRLVKIAMINMLLARFRPWFGAFVVRADCLFESEILEFSLRAGFDWPFFFLIDLTRKGPFA